MLGYGEYSCSGCYEPVCVGVLQLEIDGVCSLFLGPSYSWDCRHLVSL